MNTMASAAADVAPARIVFPQGLPGFPEANGFVLVPVGVGTGLCRLLLLRSEDPAGPAFVVMPFEEGKVPLDQADLDAAATALGMRPDDAATLLVVTLPGGSAVTEGRPRASVNLRAPIIVDRCRGTAAQCVLPQPGYQVRHLLDGSL